ncbi:hypothetical protein [Amycolatopsis sp. WQ 127309]|uniref:hypothetical protein n=1 Tax=Amycolatopsis sp. WQ 127309 TaxID=2932773 RepID=UPI001FF2EC4A|nr:hypothetical protein [Amycolatopsis sp. WQ 127309]UOZ05202.1 hypothetical protein MUY22_41270 [Amycolatopsis sp. WQ 127309]
MTGFHADPAALDALAVRLVDTADEFAAASADVEATASGDLGPPTVAAALTALTGEWSGKIRAVRTDYAATADSVHAAAKAFRGADASAAEALGRITAQPGSDDPGQTAAQPLRPADADQTPATAPSQTAAQPLQPADADQAPATAPGQTTTQPHWPAEPNQAPATDPSQTTTQPHQPADTGQTLGIAPGQTAAQPLRPADADQAPATAPGQTTTQPRWPAQLDHAPATAPGQTAAQPHQPADAGQPLGDNLGRTPTRRTDPGNTHRFGPAVFGDSGRADG